MRWLRALVCAAVLSLLASVLVVDPAVAKSVTATAKSDLGVTVKSADDLPLDPSPTEVAEVNRARAKAVADSAAKVGSQGTVVIGGERDGKVWTRSAPAERANIGKDTGAVEPDAAAAESPAPDPAWFKPRVLVSLGMPGTVVWGLAWDAPPDLHYRFQVEFVRASDGTSVWADEFTLDQLDSSGYYTLAVPPSLGILVDGVAYTANVRTKTRTATTSDPWSAWVRVPGSAPAQSRPGQPFAAAFGVCLCGTTTGRTAIFQFGAADPVNTATGAFYESVQDAKLAAPGIGFDLTRAYTSADTTGGVLGKGWTFPYEASLKVETSQVTYRAEDGQQVVYSKNTDGTYARPAGVTSNLSAISGGFALTMLDRTVLTFDTAGRLTTWKNAAKQGLTFGYNAAGLSSITDAAGRVVAVEVTGGKVAKVTLPGGRYVSYGYTNGLLSSVRDLRGGTTTYGYNADGRLDTVTNQKNIVVTKNTYLANGWVDTQVDQTGGVWKFEPNKPSAGWTTVTDPRGFKKSYFYSGNVLMQEIDELGKSTYYDYNLDLTVKSIRDRRGNDTTMTYDAAGNVKTRMDPDLKVESWGYDTSDRLIKSVDKRGMVTTYEYTDPDAPNDPSKVTETSKDGSQTRSQTFSYNSRGLLESETSFAGRTTTLTYDTAGNLATKTTEERNTTGYTYDTSGRVETQTDPRGTATSEAGDFTTTYGYDAADNLTSLRDARDHTTLYQFDPVGDMELETDPFGKTTTWTYDNAHRKKSMQRQGWVGAEKWQYDLSGNLVKHTTPTGGVTTYGWNGASQQISQYSARGNVSGVTPEEKAKYRWEFENDANGNQTLVRTPPILQPDGTTTVKHETKSTYDKLNRPTVVTDPLGHATTTGYDAEGNVVAVTNHLQQKTAYGFDGLGRRISETTPRGTATATPTDDYQTDFAYDPDDLLIGQTSPLGYVTSYGYDQDGQQTSMVDPRGNVVGADKAAFTWTYGYDPAGNATTVKDPLGNQTVTSYDPANNVSSRRDANNHTTAFGYDDKDRLTTVTAADGAQTVYGYDDLDNLTSRKDPRQNTATFGYYADGQLKEEVDPLGRKVTYTYDPEGNLAQQVTARGNAAGADPAPWTIGYDHDARDLLTAVKSPDTQIAATHFYDGAERKTTIKSGSGLQSGVLTYAYDDANRPLSLDRGGSATTSWKYDADGNVTSRTYPDETVITASFDEDQRQITSYLNGTSKMTFSYFENNLLRGVFYPTSSARNQSYNYDNAGRLSKTFSGPEATALSKYEISRDNVGNPSKVIKTGSSGASTQTFTYDEQDRITKACYAESCEAATKYIGYGYDKSGNRTSQNRVGVANPGDTIYEYDTADQLSKTTIGAASTTYTFDADGNLATAGGVTYNHDALNRQRSSVNGTVTTTINYDAEGRRLNYRQTGQTDRSYFWDTNYRDGLPRIGMQSIGSERHSFRYTDTGIPLQVVYGTYAAAESPMSSALGDRSPPAGQKTSPNSLLPGGKNLSDAEVLDALAAPSTLLDTAWLYRDWIGSVVDVTDGAEGSDTTTAGTPEWHTDYDPFGTSDTKKLTTSARDPYLGFTGEYTDPTGQQYLRARQYQPELGRFTATDPVAPDIDDPYVASYVYVENSPGRFTDPSGNDRPRPDNTGGGLGSGGRTGGGGRSSGESGNAKSGSTRSGYKGGVVKVGTFRILKDYLGRVQQACGKLQARIKADQVRIKNDAIKVNQMEQQVKRGQAPRGVKRVDGGDGVTGEQPHVHFGNKSALNKDGTWKHGPPFRIPNKIRKWLEDNGWKVPK